MRRLAKDVGDLLKDPLEDQGIWYYHNEKDFREGLAILSGTKDSLYEHGYYVFKFNFPDTYPAQPPKVTFQTLAKTHGVAVNGRDQTYVRFHPNLYINGKVCLSLLGTWDGQPWTSCCTLRTLLIIMQTLLDDDPYMHEPHVLKTDKSRNAYNQAIAFHNLLDGVLNFKRRVLPTLPTELRHRLANPLANSIRQAYKIATLRSHTNPPLTIPVWVDKYGFGTHCDYPMLAQELQKELPAELNHSTLQEDKKVVNSDSQIDLTFFDSAQSDKLTERYCGTSF
jgi:ubiquitin-conjugating enzyme E2 Z